MSQDRLLKFVCAMMNVRTDSGFRASDEPASMSFEVLTCEGFACLLRHLAVCSLVLLLVIAIIEF